MIVRTITRADEGAIWALLVELGYASLERAALARALGRFVAHDEMRAWVAEEAGAIVGLVTLSWRVQLRLGGLLATIDELVVAELARGKGVGAALVRAAKDHAHALGAARLQVETNAAREAYRRGFYPKNGFVEVDRAVLRIEPP